MKPIPALGALAAAIALAAPGAASAAPITSLFGGAVNCTTSPSGPTAGQRFCQGATAPYFVSTVPSFDGTPIDVSVTLPPAPASGDDGNFPVVGVYHGYGSSKILPTDATNAQRWLAQGYAVYSITDRGFWGSCGVLVGRGASPACSKGYIQLMSAKYEVRDAQYLLGRLADEGVINGQKIGAVGGSYGGGMAMLLGALKNRVMMPDGSLVPWTSPGGKAMRIAAAAPEYGWSDLVASLQPNGSTLDYAAQNPYAGPNGDRRFGVQKQNWNAQLYGGGAQTGWYAPLGQDPGADITAWKAFNDTGGPYDGSPVAAAQVAEFPNHGASTIDASIAPAPMIISNGWNDDLFPVDEAVRYYNRTRALHPTAPIVMYHANYGHPNRGGSPPVDDVRAVYTAETLFFNRYIKGEGVDYANVQGGVTIATSKCNGMTPTKGDTYSAENWASLSAGELRVSGVPSQTIAATTTPATTYEGGAVTVCTDGPATDTAGAATYSTQPAPAGGYTIAGSPTVVADLAVTGANDQVISRLYDVDVAAGTQKLIARGIYRPTGVGTSRQVFQLHPQAYAIAEGHRVKLELLSGDAPYARAATGQNPVGVSALDLRIPTIEESNPAANINAPAPQVLPAGYTLAYDEKEPTVVAQPTTPIVIPPIVTAVPADTTAQKPRDPLTVKEARAALADNPTGVKVSKSRKTI
ncbi:MAG: CocE/NonD family hydrolase, partial [Solirubrobacteraceae bacterium]|nr:CocE/NonD family hydrolase [Solirubrobacteraceae bacterium]